VLLLMSRQAEMSLMRRPFPDLEMAVRISKAFLTMGAW
jgi:hypothetical protein